MQRFTPEFIDAARSDRHAVGDRRFVDETYVKVAGCWTYLYRAVDQRTIAAVHAFVQNLRRGHCALTVDLPVRDRLPVALDELALFF